MARKAPPKAPAKRKRKAASAPPKRKTQARAAPARKREPTAHEQRLARYQRQHPDWRSDPHWKQKARGHKVAEHVTRRQKELDRLEAFADAQAAKGRGADADEILEGLMVWYRREGIGFLNRLIALNDANHASYVDGGYQPVGVNLDEFSAAWELPRETFFYH